MALFDDIFGGTQPEQTITDTTPRQLKALLDPFQHVFEQLLGKRAGDPLAGIPQAPGPKVAPITGAETQALADIQAQTGPGTARSQLLDRTLGGEFTAAGNPFTQAAIEAAQRPTIRAFEEAVGRVLPGQFSAAGHQVQPGQSSPFDRAAAIQSEGFANALADIATNIGFASHEAERGRQQEAIGLSQQEVDTSIKNLQAQALPRLIEQHGLDAGLAEFKARTEALISLLSLLSGGTLNQTVVTGTTESTPGVFAPIAGAAGAALAGSGG